MAEIRAHDGLNIVLINTVNAFQKGTKGCFIVGTRNDLGLIVGRYL